MANILLLEDSKPLARILAFALREEGHDVVVHHDGTITYDRSVLAKIDLLITDIDMPKVSGIEAIMLAKQARSDLKIIAMSGGGTSDGEDYLPTCKALGASATLAKPFEPDALLKLVQDQLWTRGKPLDRQGRATAV